eukprot:2380445-Pyramimonas_sp.AAC.1
MIETCVREDGPCPPARLDEKFSITIGRGRHHAFPRDIIFSRQFFTKSCIDVPKRYSAVVVAV